jgi:hypothetical protein
MKLVSRILTLLVLAGTTVFYSSCGGGDGDSKSETDQQLEKLNGTWVIQADADVTQDGKAPAFGYKDMELKISAPAGSTTFTWTMTGRPDLSPWASQGTFEFGDPVASKLKRSDDATITTDDITITYSVTDTELIMTFDGFVGAGYQGRTKSVEGDWHFEFAKK